MTFVIATIVMFFGFVLFSGAMTTITLILLFGIPFTKQLEKIDFLQSDNGIVKRYTIALFVQLFIFTAITILFYTFLRNSFFISLLVGYLFGFIGGIGSLLSKEDRAKLNSNKISDYIDRNHYYLKDGVLDQYNDNPENFISLVYKNSNK